MLLNSASEATPVSQSLLLAIVRAPIVILVLVRVISYTMRMKVQALTWTHDGGAAILVPRIKQR
jgi:hypothetical protein